MEYLLEETSQGDCNGWKWKYGCGSKRFDPNNPECLECEMDAQNALDEAENDTKTERR